MQKFKILLPVIFLTFCILTAGCISSNLNPEDKIYADYMPHGYYYFIDDDGKSFYETLWKDNMSDYINLHSSPKEWVYYIQHMRYISDGEDEAEYFSSISETLLKNGGDCEDRAILMARMLYEYGYDSCVIVTKEHVLAGIKKSQFDYNKLQPSIHSYTYNLYNLSNALDDYYIIECTASYPFKYYDEPKLIAEKIFELNH